MFTLTMTEKQARAVFDAVELLMRLKIDQPEQIFWCGIIDMMDENYCRIRDAAQDDLRTAFRKIFNPQHPAKKDDQWHRLYNVWQAMRKGLFDHPDRIWCFDNLMEPMPTCVKEEKHE